MVMLSSMPGVVAADELFTPTEDPVIVARLFQTKGCVRCPGLPESP